MRMTYFIIFRYCTLFNKYVPLQPDSRQYLILIINTLKVQKTMKIFKNFIGLAALALCLGFASCSSDDEAPSYSGGGN